MNREDADPTVGQAAPADAAAVIAAAKEYNERADRYLEGQQMTREVLDQVISV
jgi:hypothetical protein